MRKIVLLVDLLFVAWFVALQVYRFKESGRACSGDYLQPTTVKDSQGTDRVQPLPQNYGTNYLGETG